MSKKKNPYALIQPNDERYFKQTSNEPYDRHKYRLTLKSGKAIVVEDYDILRSLWFQYNKYAHIVEVLD